MRIISQEIYFLKRKSDALEAFKTFMVKMEKQTGMKIKAISNDNGSEYVNSAFKDLLNNHGTVYQTTVQYCLQQNGAVERANQTIVEMTICMLQNSGMSQNLWTGAVTTASYIRTGRLPRY
uniref:Integrase catalytic domain-containing protein n=1 Tax=Glossina brevipalpis TaxID=37001 RepID=A0A1A9X3G0_9MUSC